MTWLTRRGGAARPDVAGSVTSLELFFDLVFVFTITQLTATLGHDASWAGVGRVVLVLMLMWWMYGGYAWLTNSAPPVTPIRRAFLLLGMTGNFVMALALPHAYTTDRVVFAIGYLIVVGVHSAMYLTQSARVTRGMVLQLLLWNGLAAALIVVGAVLGGTTLVTCWIAAVLTETVLPRLAGRTPLRRLDTGEAFALQPGHFVERHGLMLIIVLGESVLAIGVGLGSGVDTIGIAQIVFAAVSLALAAVLFWAYFGTGEDDAAEAALTAAPTHRHQPMALASYGYAFAVILLGVVFAAAGLHHALEHPTATLATPYALLLAGGCAVFWVGMSGFRRALGRRDVGARLLGGLLLLVAAPVGVGVSAFAELVVLLAGSVAILVAEQALRRRSGLASGDEHVTT